ncbi:cytochrome c family protein [Desulfosarcina variabilis str. Montpellier]
MPLVLLLFMLTFFFSVTAVCFADEEEERAPGRTMADQATKEKKLWITVDHSRIEALKKDFRSGPEVTRACLSCHAEAAAQFHSTIHWTWKAYTDDKGHVYGKGGDSINNFCISTNNMQDKGCLSCHPGWGKKTEAINCLNCHGSQSINWEESFEDLGAFEGSDDPEEQEIANEIRGNIQAAVQSVVRPERQNCGSCHFKGGGGDGVKHGDLDTSLTKPNKSLDVHMGLDGRNFKCTRCHTTTLHNIAGRVYTKPAAKDRKSLIEDDLTPKITCESCHSSSPHKSESKANDHTDKVACQSCHIPMFARVNPTKVSWDWSQAGKTKDGKPYTTEDEFGKHDYMSIKGQMKWAKNVKPEYFWYNGSIRSVTARHTIDPGKVVQVSHPMGSRNDENARIFPFKVHRGRQPYDKVNKTLLTPMLSGPDGYWKTLDWNHALTVGSQALDIPFSGEFDFVDTTYVFPITHMVAPRENVVACNECHTREQSRLANLAGFYIPGRDNFQLLDSIGWILVLAHLLGVVIHGLTRIFTHTNGRKEGK